MNWLAQPASAEALAGVQGRIVDSLVAMFLASVSAASWRLTASSVPIAVGCRNGNALLLKSSDSPGTSSSFSVVSFSRSRIVLRYSRDVRRRAGIGPAALGSGGVADVPAVPRIPPVLDNPEPPRPDMPAPPVELPIEPSQPRPIRAATQVAASGGSFQARIMMFAPSKRRLLDEKMGA